MILIGLGMVVGIAIGWFGKIGYDWLKSHLTIEG
jgi:hypothetical protein